MRRLLPAILAVLLLAGCTDQGPTTPPTLLTPPSDALLSSGGTLASATGAGHFRIADELRTFSFNAIRHADGSVTGHYELHNRATGTRIHADLTCLSVVGTDAWMGGTITQSTNPAFEGNDTGFRVRDLGEGKKSPPDELSLAFVALPPGGAQAYCATMPPAPPLVPIEAGNIQVRP